MAVKKRLLLLINHNHAFREELAAQFAFHDDFETISIDNAVEGIKAAVDTHFDVILVDVDLRDMLGTHLCQLMRSQGVTTPVILLIENEGDAHEVSNLYGGVNEYIIKPFRFALLLAKLRAQLDSHEQSDDAVFQIGPYDFAPAFKKLTPRLDETKGETEDIRLTQKETDILDYLYRAKGKAVGRAKLLREVWGYNDGLTTHTLETHIYRLRKKIEPIKGKATLIVTEPGGYRLEIGK